jgi:hypothetical protein
MRKAGFGVVKSGVLVAMASCGIAAAAGGCSSAPVASTERTSTEGEALIAPKCGPNESLDCEYDLGPGGRPIRSCVCVCDYVTCGSSCVDTSSDSNNCGGCYNACDADQTCVSGVCTYPACVYQAPNCTGLSGNTIWNPPDPSPTCAGPQHPTQCTGNQVGGSFTTCPLADGSCPNEPGFETELAKLGCQPGGDPATNQRTIVCYDPTIWPPGVTDDKGDFECGYGNDWLYAVCPATQATAVHHLVSHYADLAACRPVAPSSLDCTSVDITGRSTLTSVIVYYDPSCGASCAIKP